MEARPLLSEYELEASSKVENGSSIHTDLSDHKNVFVSIIKATRKNAHVLWSDYISQVTLWSIVGLLPRWLQPGGLKIEKLHPTSYLDALRGYAAWLVVNLHLSDHMPKHWFHNPGLPLRLILAGTPMVQVFFVISGYVLSQKTLKLARQSKHPDLLQTLASSVFRRYLRLYTPIIIVILFVMVLIHNGLYAPQPAKRLSPLSAQLKDVIIDIHSLCNPFSPIEGYYHKGVLNSRYHAALWTIPVEFRGSLVVFLFCLATSKLRSKHRMILCWILIVLFYCWQALYGSLFMYGVFLAERSLKRQEQKRQEEQRGNLAEASSTIDELRNTKRKNRIGPKHRRMLVLVGCGILLVISLSLIGTPRLANNEHDPWPWSYLNYGVPPWFFHDNRTAFCTSIGAFLLILSIDSVEAFQTPFNWGFSQYLGYLSFGIYVMHWVTQMTMYLMVFSPFRKLHFGEAWWGYLLFYVLEMLSVFSAADYFARMDGKIVLFGRWLEKKLFVQLTQ